MKTPEFRQFGELSPADFERHPVWIHCHTADYRKPWYEDIDEDTYRPWTEELPAVVLRERLLVRAEIELWDGSRYSGHVTPLVEGYDNAPNGRRVGGGRHPLSRQQPFIFLGHKRFGFWGGIPGISKQEQREFYAALGKSPENVFPLQFRADSGLANGLLSGQVDGFYQGSRESIVQVERTKPESPAAEIATELFQMQGTICSGYPQPESVPSYRKAVYSKFCPRCGIYEPQKAPFRFKKSTRPLLTAFMQLNWVPDTFFVARDVANEITRAGITGVSFGPAVAGRPPEELADRVQMLIPTIVACAETSKLPPVTCRPKNEEAVRIKAMLEGWKKKHPRIDSPKPSGPISDKFRELREKYAAIPFCGKVKHHSPTSLAIIPGATKDTPDIFQTAEWFGSGACAFRLTLVSRRFADLVRDRCWKGLEFQEVRQSEFSEREQTDG